MSRLNQLQNMLKEDPLDSFLLFAIAKEHEKTKAYDEAIIYYEKIVENDSNYTGVYYHLGGILAETGNKKAAIKIYNDGIKICKEINDQHALSELKSVLMNLEIE